MKADESDVSALFSQQIVQYSIPHYQRPQSWMPEKHWDPLWVDVESKANDWLAGIEPRQHYLGSIVMAKRPRFGVRGMDKYQVIDGQQRLSTLQYLLKALYFSCKEEGYADGATSVHQELFNLNEDMQDAPEVQRFKLWPTFRDRTAHKTVMLCTSIAELQAAYPTHFTRAGLLYQGGDHPKPLHATCFFYEKICKWLDDVPEKERRIDACEALRRALTRSLQLIVLWLEQQDDPQVIFECLNGRGEPLRPTDLIKNFIFMSAEMPRSGEPVTEVTEESPLFRKWSAFDEDLWLAPQTRGRLTKPLLEWLVYYSLQAETGNDIDSSQTYQAYQKWASNPNAIVSAEAQVDVLLEHAANLRTFIECDKSRSVGRFGSVAKAVDVTIVSPLALAIARNCDELDQEKMFEALASYLVRREACGLTKKSYNQTFFSLLKVLRSGGFSASALVDALATPTANTSAWPTDQAFAAALLTRPLYRPIGLPRLILTTVANSMAKRPGGETVWAPEWNTLHLEHLLPDSWYEYWFLPDGGKVTEADANRLVLLTDNDPQAQLRDLVRRRQALKNTIGNLTVLNGPLNMELQNFAWDTKKDAIKEVTQLRMNFDLIAMDQWDEQRIEARSNQIAAIAIATWPGPDAFRA
jgi:hypothetical protein